MITRYCNLESRPRSVATARESWRLRAMHDRAFNHVPPAACAPHGHCQSPGRQMGYDPGGIGQIAVNLDASRV